MIPAIIPNFEQGPKPFKVDLMGLVPLEANACSLVAGQLSTTAHEMIEQLQAIQTEGGALNPNKIVQFYKGSELPIQEHSKRLDFPSLFTIITTEGLEHLVAGGDTTDTIEALQKGFATFKLLSDYVIDVRFFFGDNSKNIPPSIKLVIAGMSAIDIATFSKAPDTICNSAQLGTEMQNQSKISTTDQATRIKTFELLKDILKDNTSTWQLHEQTDPTASNTLKAIMLLELSKLDPELVEGLVMCTRLEELTDTCGALFDQSSHNLIDLLSRASNTNLDIKGKDHYSQYLKQKFRTIGPESVEFEVFSTIIEGRRYQAYIVLDERGKPKSINMRNCLGEKIDLLYIDQALNPVAQKSFDTATMHSLVNLTNRSLQGDLKFMEHPASSRLNELLSDRTVKLTKAKFYGSSIIAASGGVALPIASQLSNIINPGLGRGVALAVSSIFAGIYANYKVFVDRYEKIEKSPKDPSQLMKGVPFDVNKKLLDALLPCLDELGHTRDDEKNRLIEELLSLAKNKSVGSNTETIIKDVLVDNPFSDDVNNNSKTAMNFSSAVSPLLFEDSIDKIKFMLTCVGWPSGQERPTDPRRMELIISSASLANADNADLYHALMLLGSTTKPPIVAIEPTNASHTEPIQN
jgi:hypothetical protein